MFGKLTRWVMPVALAAFTLSVGSLATASADHGFKKTQRLILIEQSTVFTQLDVDQSNDQSVGDVVVFQSDLLDSSTRAQVGTAEGHCMLITAAGDADCAAGFILANGQIRVSGFIPHDTTTEILAVIGGTGAYRNVGGEITIEPIDATTSRDTLELKDRRQER